VAPATNLLLLLSCLRSAACPATNTALSSCIWAGQQQLAVAQLAARMLLTPMAVADCSLPPLLPATSSLQAACFLSSGTVSSAGTVQCTACMGCLQPAFAPPCNAVCRSAHCLPDLCLAISFAPAVVGLVGALGFWPTTVIFPIGESTPAS